MNTKSNNTIHVSSTPPHLADDIAPLIKQAIPTLTITDNPESFLCLSLSDNKIVLKHLNSGEETTLLPPIKIAKIIQHIQKNYAKYCPIKIGPYLFDYSARTLDKDNKTIHLTEKEADVLIYLDQNRGTGITRDNLLKNVWGYVDGIDTHTIETHIYRLRQKIEDNPIKSTILLTKDDGYHLGENS